MGYIIIKSYLNKSRFVIIDLLNWWNHSSSLNLNIKLII